MKLSAIYARLNKAVRDAGSQTAFATATGLSLGHVNDVLMGRVKPGPRMLKAIGVERRVVYVDMRNADAGESGA